ncbi:SIS domain-containing protein [Paracoccus litorisediminis]|uniref:SIS domain-containing protein n=1 Tax=Paracoccus litorisediminis TaxID=2006130 RepID=A0A844HNV1_9RHOB|nr:SIS domain-containing protein [Paracoccus litorisediminis]MTH59401.1 SIS domain-containing protein [Paracoccus litorisediminis]
MQPTHMAREIAELPDIARAFIRQSRDPIRDAATALRLTEPALLVTVARGSSDHAASFLKYLVELQLGIPVASVGPSIASIYARQLRLHSAACIGISQSGQSPDILAMIRSAAAGGARTLAFTNDIASPLAGAVDHVIPLAAGPERSVAATKTFVASLLAALWLVAEWRPDPALQAALTDLPEALAQAARLDWQVIEDRLTDAQSLFVLGRGAASAIAAEAALKGKETCRLHAEAYSAAEVLHGPSAIARDRFPVLVFAVDDESLPQLRATTERLAGQGADVFVTGIAVPGATTLPVVPDLHPLVAPLVHLAIWYATVERLSRQRGLNPDQPAFLQKVTQTV